MPDLQCAWVLLLMSCGLRANYHLRTQRLEQVLKYAKGHDEGMWRTLCKLLGREDLKEDASGLAAWVAQLPLRLGGGGLRSAQRCSEAAYWASWADTLPMMRTRNAAMARKILEQLQGEARPNPCVEEARKARTRLQAAGWDNCPDWQEVWDGRRPENVEDAEPGEWRHGWQYYAASLLENQFRDGAVLPAMTSASQALLRSQAGPGAGACLTALPCDEAWTVEPSHFRLVLLRRLRLELPLDVRRCKCGRRVDALGDHRAACATVGKLARRALPLERAWARGSYAYK